jgi:small conductance mechanosensitive channel
LFKQLNDFLASDRLTALVVPFLVNVLAAVLIYIVGKWISVRVVRLIEKLMVARHADQALRGFVSAVLSTVFTIIVILAAVQQLGLNVTSLLAVLGAAGLAIGLALKDSLSNFAAGVMLIFFRPFHVGDWVEAAGVSGEIEGITIFHTLMNSGDNKQIIVPNSKIYEGTITNYSTKPTRRIDLVIGVGYSDDLKQAKALILSLLAAESRILPEPAPLVAVDELAESSVNFVVRPWVAKGDYWSVRRQLIENIKASFDAHGISIPFPQTDLHIHRAAQKSAVKSQDTPAPL